MIFPLSPDGDESVVIIRLTGCAAVRVTCTVFIVGASCVVATDAMVCVLAALAVVLS